MRERKNVKKWIWVPVLLLVITLITISAVIVKTVRANETESLFNLSERDILLEVGETKKVELESDEIKINQSKMDVAWISSKPSVATVGSDGTITAAAGGETKITAIVEYKDHEYSTSCVVTVKAEGKEYSTYKIRWFTQKKDRSEYEVMEETYERLVGSSVELTELDAKKNCPSNYVLNTEKSTLAGKVKERLGACILEVYFDVAEVQYSVDYYYESATALGTYTEKETKKYTAYAFSKVTVTDAPKTGFVINDKASGTVKSNESVVAGSKLKVYCNRIRSQVTVKYISGREGATYECIYGVGLLNAPADVFSDSIEYKIATYVNGEKKQATADLMKTVTADTKVEFKLDGAGFTYSKGTITNETDKKASLSYAVLKGSSDTLYLSATYKTTGSSSNTFGITLSNGKTSREIRFSKQGVAIMKDNTTSGGILSSSSKTNAYRNAGVYNDGNVFVWAQNPKGTSPTVVSSVVNDMLKDRIGGNYDIRWAVLDGVLYCSVEEQTVLRLPLTYLDETWTANQKYEIGFSSYDASAWGDALKISNVKNVYGEEAKALLKTETFDGALTLNMAYDAFTGSYFPASKSSAAYMYAEETSENTGVSADVKWVDKDNTASAIGVTLKVGEESIQYVVQGMNTKIRTQMNHKWGDSATRKDLKKQTLAEVTPFNEDGTTQVTAFVKDGYFHVLYNGVQVYCANMLALYPEYTPDSEVSVGICSWDANLGLAEFSNVTELTAADIAAGIAGAEDWGFYAEAGELSADAYDFTAGSITKSTKKTNEVTLLGSNATWQIEGTMNRPLDGTTADLLMGFRITSGEQSILIMGRNNGFQKGFSSDSVYRKYSDNPSVYAFNTIVSERFFNKNNTNTRTQESIDFKAVLYKDVLYVWFTDVDGNSGLCWRIPLTEEQFGGFKAGSDYEMGLYFANGATDLDASMTNLEAKMGYQVTGQTEFVVDNAGNTYDVASAAETIEDNVTRWDSFNVKTISGMVAEELDTLAITSSASYAYLDGSSSDIYLSATYELDSAAKFFGISLKQGDESIQVVYNSNGVSLLKNLGWNGGKPDIPVLNGGSHNTYNKVTAGYIWAPSSSTNNTVYAMVNTSAEATYDVAWAITDGVLYGMVDDFVFLRMPVKELCEDWNEDTEFQIGFAQWDIKSNKDVTITKNIEVSLGDDALAKMVNDKKVDSASTNGMDYEVFTGSYLPDVAGGTKYMYSVATNITQSVSVAITPVNKSSNTASAGISVKSGDNSAQIVVQGNNNKVRILANHGWSPGFEVTSWITADRYNADGVCDAIAVIKDGTLYLFYNDVLAGSVDLYKILPGYVEGDNVQLGICARDPKNGMFTFSDISFATGADAVKDITLSNDKEWEIFTNAEGTISASGTNMTGAGNTGVVQPTESSSGHGYIYGVATGMNQKLTTKLTVESSTALTTSTNYCTSGITVECNGSSFQFNIEGIKPTLSITPNYGSWTMRQKITIPTCYMSVSGDGVYKYEYDITAMVKDGMFYLMYGDNAVYSIALNEMFDDYSSSDEIRLGMCTYDAKNGTASFSNISYEAGSVVNNVTVPTQCTEIAYLVKEIAYLKFENNGNMTKNSTSNAPYMMFAGASETWEVSGTYSIAAANAGALYSGFRITTNETTDPKNNMLCVLGKGTGIRFLGRKETGSGSYTCDDFNAVGNKYAMNNVTDIFSAKGKKVTVSFKAIISDDTLYVWMGANEESLVPVWRVELDADINYTSKTGKAFIGFKERTKYNFGIFMTSNANYGTFNFETVKNSDIDTNAVNAFETAYQEYAKTLE